MTMELSMTIGWFPRWRLASSSPRWSSQRCSRSGDPRGAHRRTWAPCDPGHAGLSSSDCSVLREDQIVEVETEDIVAGGSGCHPARWQNPGGRPGLKWPLVCGAGRDHWRTNAKRKRWLEAMSYAGTINQAGTLQVARSVWKRTTFGKIIEAVENAERSRAPIQKTADRLAGYWFLALGARYSPS